MDYTNTTCDNCKCDLIWHTGAFRGWVHSNNIIENQKLFDICRAIKLRRKRLTLMGFDDINNQLIIDPPIDVDKELEELEAIQRIQE